MEMLKGNYERDGFVGPIRALDSNSTSLLLDELKEKVFEQKGVAFIRNRHLDIDSVKLLCQSEVIHDAVSEILGTNLVLWRTNFFAVKSGQGHGWHQDRYIGLLDDTSKQVSVHLALTKSSPDNCLKIIQGSHQWSESELERNGLFKKSEKSAYGTFQYQRDPDKKVNIVPILLQPGEFIVFHPNLIHAPNDFPLKKSIKRKAFSAIGRAKKFLMKKSRQKANNSTARLAFGMRITTSDNKVYPKAFQQTLPRVDKCVPLRPLAKI
ncbi:MAG: phytanoyl-CoA dioxygenase family protein [Synechococcus sp.]